MPQGKIKRLVADRGFGFVEGERGDVFFHHSDMEGCSFDDLQEGQTLEYNIGRGAKGPRATNCKLLEQ